MREWERILPKEDHETYAIAGYGGDRTPGNKPCLLIIDCTYGFTGKKGQTLREAQAEHPHACGPAAWEALPKIRDVLTLFRELGHPVIYTRPATQPAGAEESATKSRLNPAAQEMGNEFPELIAPREGEWVLEKTRASAFFGTPLVSTLVQKGVDTVFVTGTTTSGCVRASCLDGFSYGFKMFVVEDGCFDRAHLPHLVNLWDMHAKYGTVVTADEVPALLGNRSQGA